MSSRKHPAPAVALAIATAVIAAPFASADQSTEIPAFSAAASLASPGPGALRLASMVDSSRRTTALEYARFERSQAAESTPPPSGTGSWSKTGKMLTIIGGVVAAAGGVMVAAGSDQEYEGGFNVDWKTTGYVWIGAGVVLVIIGLTRRN